MKITKEWIAEQRALCKELEYYGHTRGSNIGIHLGIADTASAGYEAALDALEALMQRETEKDEEIARLTAERDAANKRADVAEHCLTRIDREYSKNSHDRGDVQPTYANVYALVMEWKGDAPTGAESEGEHA